jgi:Protein of unknown function, DUF547
MKYLSQTLTSFVLLLTSSFAFAFDHSHKAWEDLLKAHVKLINNGNASQVNYKGFVADRAKLDAYTNSLSAVPKATFDGFSKPQQQAFLMNAYNAFTIVKILQRYPNIKSIRDFGNVIGNPWKDKFISLLGTTMTLDNIEHDTLRAAGVYDDPRVHVAVVCASIGCPMLRNDAFTAEKLDAQLEDGMKRFLGDRSRNRYNKDSKSLEVSKIFEWYRKDFEKNHKGYASLEVTLAKYADQLADSAEDRAAVKGAKVPVKYLDYDWNLNDVK